MEGKNDLQSSIFLVNPKIVAAFLKMQMLNYQQLIIIMNLLKISSSELESAIVFSNIMEMEDLNAAASILASYDWDIERALGSIDLNLQSVEKKQSEARIEDKARQEQKLDKKELIKFRAEQSKLGLKKLKNDIKSIIKKQAMYQSEKIHNFSQVQQKKQAMEEGQKKKNVATNQVFMSYITNKYHPLINFAFDSFASNLKRSFKERKHVLVYVHQIDDEIERQYHNEVEQIMKNRDIARFVNTYCIAYGVIHESPEYAVIAEYISKQKNTPLFAVFKYDHIHRKEEFLSYYNPKAHDFNFLQWLSMTIDISVERKVLHRVGERFKHSKSNSNLNKQSVMKQQLLEEDEFMGYSYLSDYKQEEKKIPSHINWPAWKKSIISSEESKINPSFVKKRREDNHLMEEQDAAYHKMMNSYLRKKDISQLKHQQSQMKVNELQVKQKELKDRQKKMENLFSDFKDQNYINVKFRLADGFSIIQKFSLKDKAQKLFIYVDIFCREHFQEKFNDFGLVLVYSDLLLEDLKQELLEKVFEEEKAVTVIVKET